MLVALDTNILLRLLDRADPHHQIIRESLRSLSKQNARFCFFPQNATEFWSVCTRPSTARGGYGLSLEETDKRLKLLERIFPVLPDQPAMYPVWRQLVETHGVVGVQVHDAKLVAAMQIHGVTHLLTMNDSDFRRYPGISALAPASAVWLIAQLMSP